jgi:phospholipid/cholesterol/gamma-HCH transport system substrate-binding protein
MSVFSEHDKRFEGLEPRSGLFIAIAVLIVLGTVVASLIKHDAFTSTMRILFFAQSAQGINKGMSVQLSGFKIGTVQDLNIEPDARVRVMLAIEKKYTILIPQDSEAGLSKEALIGASFIEIEPGKDRTRTVAEDSVLKFYRTIDFADMAQDLKEKLDPILADVKQVTQSINDPEGDIRKTIGNVRHATALVAELAQQVNQLAKRSEGRVDAIAGKVDRVLDQTGATLEGARGALDTAARSLDTVNRQLPALLLRLDQSLKNVESVTADARRLSSSLGEDLPPAIREGRGLVEDAHEIVDGAKQAWPVRNFVAPPGQKALPLDSYDSSGSAR